MSRDQLHEAICRTVYGCVLAAKVIAADLDMSSSHLSRMLSDHDALKFPFEKIPALMRITNNYLILDTLAELSGREVRLKEINLADVADRIVAAHEATAKEYAELVTAIKALDGNGKP